ncbi:hypothetical protein BDZ45DRAFT_563170, partial [Acephala macrosclerotiorum]
SKLTGSIRFADKQLGYRERRLALSNLIQTYLSTFADIGVETWLMHGTLLGWWWNRKILPWDSDSDVQVSEASIHYLASYYNMSIFHYKTPRIPEGRDYMLEVNPHYVNREQSDKLNVIDARWVDTTSGLFIDITTARYNHTHPAGPGMLSCKDGHEYRDSYIFPLRDTFFEGVPAKIPFAYKELLEAEYKEKALTLTDFEGHHFDEQKLEWIPVPKKVALKKPEPKKEEKKAEAPKQQAQNQQGQQKQEPPQQNQQSNQQKQQTDQQKSPVQQDKPKSEEKPQAPSGGQAQGQKSPPPSVVKQGTQPLQSKAEPQKPTIQVKAEEKKLKADENVKEKLEKVEDKRKSAEEQAIKKTAQKEEQRQKDLK